MRKMVTQTLAIVVIMTCVSCTHSVAANAWRRYTFGAGGLHEAKGPGGPFLLVRDGYMPIISAGGPLPAETPLPAGKGALAGVCYLQSSGGKLRDTSGYLPLAGAVVEVSGDSGKLEVRTDGEGYFFLVLPEGDYSVRVAGLSHRISVEKGKTTLVALRGGKRMVD